MRLTLKSAFAAAVACTFIAGSADACKKKTCVDDCAPAACPNSTATGTAAVPAPAPTVAQAPTNRSLSVEPNAAPAAQSTITAPTTYRAARNSTNTGSRQFYYSKTGWPQYSR